MPLFFFLVMSNSKEKEAAGTLEKLIESLRQVGIVVSDFESQEALNKLLYDGSRAISLRNSTHSLCFA